MLRITKVLIWLLLVLSLSLLSAITCENIVEPEQGSVDCVHSYGPFRFNSSCRFHCAFGYQVLGAPRLLCTANGHWNHPTPLCKGMGTEHLDNTFQQQRSPIYLDFWMYKNTFSHCLFLVEQCPVLSNAPSERRTNCSHPIAPYSYNSTCEFWCDEGYTLSGGNKIHCDHTGQWTASVPSCTGRLCDSRHLERCNIRDSHDVRSISMASTKRGIRRSEHQYGGPNLLAFV